MLKQTLQSALSFFSKRVKIGIRLLLWCVAFPFLLQSILFMSSCAQVVMPSGGKTDTVPPHVRKSVPENGSANFNSKRVEIQFDEFIQLKDLNSQLLISPPMEKQPDVKVKNKTLSIEFQEPLKPNTTYNLNFGSAIADIHESKAAVNFRYVFSTGAFVDSLSVSGTVRNAHTGNPEKAVFVMLYDNAADSTPYLHVPAYFGRTDVNGFYRINNIRAATYRVVALQDANNNYLVNTDEQIGFRTEPLVLQRNDTVNLRLFKEETARQRIRKAYQAGYGKILLAFNKRVEGLKLRPLNCELNATDQVIESNKGGDTITFWYLKPKPDSLLLEVGDKDRIYDTLRYKLITREKMLSQNKGVKPPLVIKTNVNRDRPFDLDAPLIFVPQGYWQSESVQAREIQVERGRQKCTHAGMERHNGRFKRKPQIPFAGIARCLQRPFRIYKRHVAHGFQNPGDTQLRYHETAPAHSAGQIHRAIARRQGCGDARNGYCQRRRCVLRIPAARYLPLAPHLRYQWKWQMGHRSFAAAPSTRSHFVQHPTGNHSGQLGSGAGLVREINSNSIHIIQSLCQGS
jgi:hypothetical protein